MKNYNRLNRREFLKLAGAMSLAGLVVSCSPATTTSAPTATTVPATAVPADPYGKFATTVVLKTVRSFDPTEKLPAGDTAENNQYTRYVKDTLNIDTQYLWTAATTDYDQKVNLAIASNDIPDAMVVTLVELQQMIKADQLADLTDTYNNYASPKVKQMMDSSKGLALKAVTKDGKILAIPSLTVPDNSYSLMWIRKDWLDKLGLPVPKTMDDVEKTAQAFIDQDPGGNGAGKTIGIVGPQNGQIVHANFMLPENNLFGLDSIFAAYRSYPGFWVKGTDGKAAYGSILPETKTALAKLADLYKKGLIDKEMGIRKDSSEPVIGGQAGIYFGMWWSGYFPLPDAIKNNPKADWQAYAVPVDDTGTFNQHMGTPANTFMVVRKGYEHPEAAMEIVNLFNRDEALFDLTKGSTGNEVLRLPMGMYDEGQFTYLALKDILAGKATPEQYADAKYDVYKLLKDDASKIKKVKIEPYDKMDIQYWDVNADASAWQRLYSIMVGMGPIYDPAAKMNLVYSLTYAPTPTVDSKWTNLQKLEDETFLKIILGSASVDTFDQFVTDWKAQGGDQVTTEIQAEIQ